MFSDPLGEAEELFAPDMSSSSSGSGSPGKIFFVPGLDHDPDNPSPYVISMVQYVGGINGGERGEVENDGFKLVNGGSTGYRGEMFHVLWRGSFPTMRYMEEGRIHKVAESIVDGIYPIQKYILLEQVKGQLQ